MRGGTPNLVPRGCKSLRLHPRPPVVYSVRTLALQARKAGFKTRPGDRFKLGLATAQTAARPLDQHPGIEPLDVNRHP